MVQMMGRMMLRMRVQLDWQSVATMLAVKTLLLAFGALSYLVLANRHITEPRGLLEIWNRWDTPHFLDLAQYGYQSSGEMRLWLVFYPLYPWLIRLFALFTGNYLASGFLVSSIASVVAGLLLQRLVQLDHSRFMARRAVWFLFIFPTSYFLHIAYTESLFLLLALGCFLAARKQQWFVAGVLGALASLTRVNGLVLIPALLLEAFDQYRQTRRWQWHWLWIGLIALGTASYLLLNYQVTGHPFTFLTYQREHWHKSLAWPWISIPNLVRSIWWQSTPELQIAVVNELLFIALGLICAIACAFKERPAYTIWMLGNVWLGTSTSYIQSMPRYTLIMFPIFILFARLAVHHFWYAVFTVWSLLYLALFVSLFVQYHWAA